MSDRSPLVVDWQTAQVLLHAEIEQRRTGRDVMVVGVTGPVGAGKSTLARRLSSTVVSTDSYLPDYERVPRERWDDPTHADLDLMARNLEQLRSGRAAAVPVWSFQSHSRQGYRAVSPARIVVCEGIHALNVKVRAVLDLAVYVEAPASVRWTRCERRELSGERGWGVEVAREFFHQVAEPTFSTLAHEYRNAADVVVVNEH